MVDLTKHAAAIVQAMEAADCGHHLELTRLVDGVSTYTVKVGEETAEFEWLDDAQTWIGEVKTKRKSAAILAACTALWNEADDMASVGRALMEALPDGYHYNDCPSEIVSDLQNRIAELEAARDPLPPMSELFDHDEAVEWISANCMAIRRDNGNLDYSLGAMIRAYEAGRAATLKQGAAG
ncbi:MULTISPECIES: hypothetical protein [unclassified Novosphingobium]|uniref:hypothetical protein n=1 Tax=unclassified Novosphingobium TaxID=2644732 RepID=UPI000D312B26|nr:MULTISPECIES: hypothetical protein [unclassified Novosphingobium]PTR11766.1 hypothetical protein C8K11_104125 [Novosphingobium sp. GV055]PUB04806.1 hypothetical protein C8K12_104125 [Novosphingobium sp. GV061]PUB21125.1 hypothetical protein C8K14_104125 [Novosphingobium sp. GV079]PUB42851.1 hypothetical protein C8K10_104125 [Novosphingobium sp. GV027]